MNYEYPRVFRGNYDPDEYIILLGPGRADGAPPSSSPLHTGIHLWDDGNIEFRTDYLHHVYDGQWGKRIL